MDKPYFVAQIYLCVYRFFPFPYFRQCFRGLASIFHHVLSRVNSNVFDEASDLQTLQLPQCYQAALCRWEITADIWRSPEVRWWILGPPISVLHPPTPNLSIYTSWTWRSTCAGKWKRLNSSDMSWITGSLFSYFQTDHSDAYTWSDNCGEKDFDFVLPVCSLDQ